ncbi:MAG: sodium-dependent transporter [Ignavibacterium sp.]|jgi:NSS family neurotransmitter:Na+ symporter|uniref:sodium-dependent transporter n=1 Tax=Ignavibacterium sp. TaxID=2651167 RepID=UPI003296C286
MKQQEFFSTRWALIISVLGIAVGTGNIWRFSRVVAQNGGGSFLIPWVIFLLLWSVPLIIAEFAIGKYSRLGPIGAMGKIAGKNFSWMGAFIVMVATGIMFYYSVVTGWCLRYFLSAASGNLMQVDNHLDYWNQFASGYLPMVFHLIAIGIVSFVVFRGITNGIEKFSKVLVPTLLIILFGLFVRAITLPGAIEGIKYFFTPDLNIILDYKVWLNALTQNAWDTGAGWGLIMTYAIYMRHKEDISLNASLIAFGNNSISLVAGITIFSTVFALSTVDGNSNALQQISQSGPANTGLTFIYLPKLFGQLSESVFINSIFASAFFLALFFAALTSLISMFELGTRTLIDFGVGRRKAILFVSVIAFLFGLPSAINMDFLINQDWVWGVGLLLSGAFIAFAIIKFGVNRFRNEVINGIGSDVKIGKWYNIVIKYLVPVQVIALVSWWLVSSVSWDPEWWNPFHTENAGTALFQWLIVITAFLIFNKRMYHKTVENNK